MPGTAFSAAAAACEAVTLAALASRASSWSWSSLSCTWMLERPESFAAVCCAPAAVPGAELPPPTAMALTVPPAMRAAAAVVATMMWRFMCYLPLRSVVTTQWPNRPEQELKEPEEVFRKGVARWCACSRPSLITALPAAPRAALFAC